MLSLGIHDDSFDFMARSCLMWRASSDLHLDGDIQFLETQVGKTNQWVTFHQTLGSCEDVLLFSYDRDLNCGKAMFIVLRLYNIMNHTLSSLHIKVSLMIGSQMIVTSLPRSWRLFVIIQCLSPFNNIAKSRRWFILDHMCNSYMNKHWRSVMM